MQSRRDGCGGLLLSNGDGKRRVDDRVIEKLCPSSVKRGAGISQNWTD